MSLYDVMRKMAEGEPTFPDDTENVSERMTDPRSQTQIVKNAPMATPREGGRFMSPNITGDYGTRYFGEEESMVNTPVLPQPGNEEYYEPETISTIKAAGYDMMLQILGLEKFAQSPASLQTMAAEGMPVPPTPPTTPSAGAGAPPPPQGGMVQPPPQASQLTPSQMMERAAQPPATLNTPAAQAWTAFRQ